MTDAITSATQQGVVSTQIQQAQSTVVTAPPPPPTPEAPPAPPVDSGRGGNVDTSA